MERYTCDDRRVLCRLPRPPTCAPGRSQPIWTMRVTPTEASQLHGVFDGECRPVLVHGKLDVEVAVAVGNRSLKRWWQTSATLQLLVRDSPGHRDRRRRNPHQTGIVREQ